MCTSVYFTDKKLHITTIGELAHFFNVSPTRLVWECESIDEEEQLQAVCERIDFETCLCPINIHASLKRFGYIVDNDSDGDPMCYKAHKRLK
jgi:hypothetical protein